MALGDLSKQIEVDARGEILDLKNTVNGMVVRCAFRFVLLSFFFSLFAFRSPTLCPEERFYLTFFSIFIFGTTPFVFT